MSNIETYTSSLLVIEVEENGTTITIRFKGKSTEREPGTFILPILLDCMQNSVKYGKKIVMNFESLEYMNSSTITPLIKILENARDNSSSISIVYMKTKKWQELCFSALKIFETRDRKIEISGN